MSSESTIIRTKHDRLNPYAMINRHMLQDSEVSFAARGFLSYLLSLPDDWKLYHAQVMKDQKIGERALNTILKELIEHGYCRRTRERVKGVFKHYKYEISEFKIKVPDCVIQPGLSSLDSAALLNTNLNDTEYPLDTLREPTKKTPPPQSSSSSSQNLGAPPPVDDDEGEREKIKESYGDIHTVKTNGEKVTTTSSQIFAHFLGRPYVTEVVIEAINRLRENDGPVNNVLSYLESTCESIVNGRSRQRKGRFMPRPACEPVKEEVVIKPLISMADYIKNNQKVG